MRTLLQEYLDRPHRAGNPDQLTRALDFGAASFGASLFAYLAFPTSIGAKPRLITNYPLAWRAHYFARRYENSDPVVHRFQRQPDPFYWSADTYSRSWRVTVPNLGGYLGASMRCHNSKLSFGYRADTFFNAVDGGQETAKSYNRGFYGPYLNVSLGL